MRNPGNGVVLETLGCKLNQAESESLAWRLAEGGYRATHRPDRADVYILNTCTVTHVADRKSRHLLRLARRLNPDALIIAAGCYAQRAADDLQRMPEVDVVLDNESKHRLPELLRERGVGTRETGSDPPPLRTRSFIRVQQGCSRCCTYCIVPAVRGRERSVHPDEVVNEVRARAGAGYREVVLTGTRIGAYNHGLKALVRRVLAETTVERVRLSSLQPDEITAGLLALWQDRRLCRHLHIALQSGCDRVLQRMGRRYSTGDYERAVHMVRQAIPDVAITTDVIVGFPGESDEQFEDSYRFCQRMEFARIHVFPYSRRPGTIASTMPDNIDERVRRLRRQRMLELAAESARRFSYRFRGRTMPVLWEQQTSDRAWTGLTDNYIRVVARSAQLASNALLPARLEAGTGQCLEASPVHQTIPAVRGI